MSATSTAAVQSTPAPIEWQNAERSIALVLSSNGTDRYRVTRSADAITCTCRAASFGNPCRHVKLVQAHVAAEALRIAKQAASLRFCAHCDVNPTMNGMQFCSSRCQEKALDLEVRVLSSIAPEPECFCRCVRCSSIYPFSDWSSLLCGDCAAARAIAA